MHEVYLGLGSNEGNRIDFLHFAVMEIEENLGRIEKKSSVYETEPWGYSSSSNFYNAVIKIHTNLSATSILKICKSIEQKAGRKQKKSNEGYADRPLDIDILIIDTKIIDTKELTIPHRYIKDRNFVLMPLFEIAPNITLPGNGKKICQLKSECKDCSNIKRTNQHY